MTKRTRISSPLTMARKATSCSGTYHPTLSSWKAQVRQLTAIACVSRNLETQLSRLFDFGDLMVGVERRALPELRRHPTSSQGGTSTAFTYGEWTTHRRRPRGTRTMVGDQHMAGTAS
jgi:hypothetical protein